MTVNNLPPRLLLRQLPRLIPDCPGGLAIGHVVRARIRASGRMNVIRHHADRAAAERQ
jgi:hypothetical protein